MEASAEVAPRYPALRMIAFILRILAVVTLIGGALITIVAAIEVSGVGETIVTAVGGMILTVIYVVITLAFAELIELAVSVEANTRRAATH
jgi:hypothetical protein